MAGIICAGFVYSPIPFGLRHICASCGYHKDRHSTALAPIVKAAPADAPATERDLYDDLSDALDKVRTIPAAVPAPPVAETKEINIVDNDRLGFWLCVVDQAEGGCAPSEALTCDTCNLIDEANELMASLSPLPAQAAKDGE